MVFIKYIFILFLLINNSCTNTRILLEGTKQVINKTSKDVPKIASNKDVSIGHYKVGNPYEINGIEYIPKLVSKYDEIGIASWYGPKFNLKKTSNGEIFYQDEISAAHKTLPLPSIVKVTNITSNRVIYLRVNDRGPFVNDRIIDFSKKAAIKFNFYEKGMADVRVQLIDSGPHLLEKKYLNHGFLTTYAKNIDLVKNRKIIKNSSVLLQVGAFKEKKNALNLINFLKSKINDNLFIKDILILDNELIYKVFAGPFKEESVAKEVANKLLELGFNTIYKKE
ncbi:MAG: hypothetical protein CMJ06_02940 [Pelagibacterales bacterium]|nr:hypothetical protein [Pelagibacterales bacterium]OUU62861.1 MAG: hypothetical protein CBC22_02920 [Alphaproteobacteria bacterium TMED62]